MFPFCSSNSNDFSSGHSCSTCLKLVSFCGFEFGGLFNSLWNIRQCRNWTDAGRKWWRLHCLISHIFFRLLCRVMRKMGAPEFSCSMAFVFLDLLVDGFKFFCYIGGVCELGRIGIIFIFGYNNCHWLFPTISFLTVKICL